MLPFEVQQIHEYILEHDLLNEVEQRTKRNWRGAGSRTTYYNGVKKACLSMELTLVEGLMLEEAKKVVSDHEEESKAVQAA